uniref:Uncharacterized protein n=1 Tax=viral metagenome TaxID=1070528 RepID=A0A6C0D367_9ZZZZ
MVDEVGLVVVKNISLRKPSDGEVLVQDHSTNQKVVEEYAPSPFNADFSATVTDPSTFPVERAVVL